MNIGEMQRKLSLKAEKHKEHQFDDLYNLLYHPDWLRLAHDRVAENAGSITAGCDGLTMQMFDADLEGNLNRLADELKAGTFEPYPVRRVYIPKTNGKKRPLGIPSIRDRIVQEALRMVLEPIFEADFDQHSFGFRPNRRTQDAIQCVMSYTTERKKFFWIIEGDISSYFDTINHRKLIKLLRRRIRDGELLDLVWKFLRAGVMERKLFKDTLTGAPQGGILSPLLANIYLNELDAFMRERGYGIPQKERTARRKNGLSNFGYARYADDFVVMCNGSKAQAEAFKKDLHEFLKGLRLELSMEKTRVTHLNDGFNFLGFHIKRCMSSKGILRQTFIPDKALQEIRHKIEYMTSPVTYGDSDSTKIMALNRLMGGWCRYYQYTGRANQTFRKVNHWLYWNMAHWFAGKYRTSIPNIMKRYKQDSTFASGKYRLMIPTDIKSQKYQKSYKKPNPYTTDEFWRETRLDGNAWSGREARPGLTDLKPRVLERDNYTCQHCGCKVTDGTAEIDHKKPFRRFKVPVNANRLANLITSCRGCNRTKSDRQMESRVQGNLYARFGEGSEEKCS